MDHIDVSADLLADAANLSPKDRQDVEKRKDEEGVDAAIAKSFRKAAISSQRAYASNSTDVERIRARLRDSIDIALAVLAFAQDEKEIEYVHARARTLSPRRKPEVSLDTQEVAMKLKVVFYGIAEAHKQVAPGSRKKIARRKVNLAIKIIVASFNSQATR